MISQAVSHVAFSRNRSGVDFRGIDDGGEGAGRVGYRRRGRGEVDRGGCGRGDVDAGRRPC